MKKLFSGLLAALVAAVSFAQVQPGNLPPATLPLTGTEQVPMQQNGATKQAPVSAIQSGSSGAPATAPYLLQAPTTGLNSARTLTGTTNQVILTDGGAGGNMQLSLPQDINTQATPQFKSVQFIDITGIVFGNGTSNATLYPGATCAAHNYVSAIDSSGLLTCGQIDLTHDVFNNLPVTNLNSGTGASASTFWRGDGTWASASSGSGSVTSVALTAPSGFSVTGSPVTTSGTLGLATSLSGLIKGTGSGFTTAASSDVIGLWTGTCNSSSFLRASGACAAPASTGVTSVGLTEASSVPIFTITNSPVTTTGTLTETLKTQSANLVFAGPATGAATQPTFRAIVNGDLTNSSVTYNGVAVALGASGTLTLASSNFANQGTTTTLLHGNAAGNPSFGQVANTDLVNNSFTLNGSSVALGGTRTLSLASADFANQGTTTTVLHGNAAGNPSFGAVALASDVSGNLPVTNLNSGTSASSTTYWSGAGTWTTPAGSVVGANPTGSVGLTAVNGVATTFTRSDSTHALDVTIAPTWTGQHTFNNSMIVAPAATAAGITLTETPTIASYGLKISGINQPANADIWIVGGGTPSSSNSTNIEIDRANSSAATVGAGPNLFLKDTGATSSSVIQHAGTHLEFYNNSNNGGAALIMSMTGSGSATTAITGRGPTAAALVDMNPDKGTFTLTYATGCGTTPTGTATWNKMGNLVALNFPSIACATSTTTGWTLTGLPAAIQPSGTFTVLIDAIDNTLEARAMASFAASGTITLQKILSTGVPTTAGWTASGVKTLNAQTVTYMLNK